MLRFKGVTITQGEYAGNYVTVSTAERTMIVFFFLGMFCGVALTVLIAAN